jgi:hypothetical protein
MTFHDLGGVVIINIYRFGQFRVIGHDFPRGRQFGIIQQIYFADKATLVAIIQKIQKLLSVFYLKLFRIYFQLHNLPPNGFLWMIYSITIFWGQAN